MNIPSDVDVWTYNKINSLSREAKKNYYVQLLRKILKANPDGLTAPQISKELNALNSKYSFNPDTLNIYLNQLVSMREAYTSVIGNATVYKYNGRLLHADKKTFFEKEGRTYHLIEIENPNLLGEHFFLIQEREKTPHNIDRVVGGVLIPKKYFYDFVAAMEAATRAGDINER